MRYDAFLPHLGEFGPYQRRVYSLLGLMVITCALQKLAGVFLSATPEHRCRLPNEPANLPFKLPDNVMNKLFPIDVISKTWSSCLYLAANYSNDQYLSTDASFEISLECYRFIYDTKYYKSSTVIEWDLVCDKAWLRKTSDALFMVGVLVGSLICGHLSDKIGRKPMFITTLVIQSIFGIAAGVAPNFVTYMVWRCIVGAAASGAFLVAYVIVMEMVGRSMRMYASVISMMFFAYGYILTAVFANFITNWRWLQIAITLPSVLLISSLGRIPESARWLLSKNRKADAIVIIARAARENKVEISPVVYIDLYDATHPSDVKKASLFDLLWYPNLRRTTLLMFFNWFVITCTYYGVSWNTNNMSRSVLLNFIISWPVEIPACLILLLTLNRYGRRATLSSCMMTSGAILLLTVFVPHTMHWLQMVLAMMAKLAITSSYGTVYMYSSELFPTPVRNGGIGASSMIGHTGGVLAPYVKLLSGVWKPLPLIIFGAMALCGGLMSQLLPETLNTQLPETIEEAITSHETKPQRLPKYR